MTRQEQVIQQLINKTGDTQYTVADILAYDKAVDKAKAREQLEFDLTADQKKIAQFYVKSKTRAKGVYTFTPRQRKVDNDKIEIVKIINAALENAAMEKIAIIKNEKQIDFQYNGNEYSISLTKHRKEKGG